MFLDLQYTGKMRLWRASLVPIFAVGCGPNVDTTAADVETPPVDAAPEPPDARPPLPDVAPPVVTMWVHSADTLFRMDDATLSLTLVGAFDAPGGDRITDLAVAPDGSLYGISETKLYAVDDVSGAATYRADVPGLSNVGLTFLPDGTLLATDQAGGVRSIDPATGQVTEIGTFGGGYATAGDLVAVVDGTLYAISDEGPVGNEQTNNWLLTVDPSTGAASPVGQIGFGGVFGAAYANGHVYAFTRDGDVIEIDRASGAGTRIRNYPVAFWGAGVTPLVVVE